MRIPLYLSRIDSGLLTNQNYLSIEYCSSQWRGGRQEMVEALLSGIVLGLIPITLVGLFVTAYLQYRRGDQLDF